MEISAATATASVLRRRTAVALWSISWALLAIAVVMAGVPAIFAAAIAFGLGRHGGPRSWGAYT